ncbi:hypothetical protein [Devosia sp.]|uniref:hypothetical protein n=1 Tax=Devosia sp. TaxID=1871048 RepID=UPI0032659496
MPELQKASLPEFLHPHRINTLVRLGRDNDGGYVVDQRSVDASKLLVGLGINDDWSFEEDFARATGAPVLAFDPTVGLLKFRNTMIKSAARIDKPGIFARNLRLYRSYKQFFGKHSHVMKYVSDRDSANSASFDTVMAMARQTSDADIFLKVDIEGSEYRVFEDIVAHAARFSGMALELHDVDLHMPKIEAFISAFPLNLCHLHVNNYGTISRHGVPTVLELSFTRFEVEAETVAQFPGVLDMPNDANGGDIAPHFVG